MIRDVVFEVIDNGRTFVISIYFAYSKEPSKLFLYKEMKTNQLIKSLSEFVSTITLRLL